MRWKIYFGILCLLALLSSASIFSLPKNEIPASIIHLVIFVGELIGLYAFLFHKNIVTPTFWKYFFWLNVFLDITYFLYSFYPNFPLLHYYSYLEPGDVRPLWEIMLAVAADLPLLFALYKLSKNEFFTPKKITPQFVSPGIPQWGMIQTALWGYAFIITSIFAVSSLFPISQETRSTTVSSESYFGAIIILPIVIFWVWIIVQYKNYKKSWWRLTLLANGIVFALLMLTGLLFPAGEFSEIKYETDLITLLQFAVILLALYVFGKEQFKRKIKNQKKDISS